MGWYKKNALVNRGKRCKIANFIKFRSGVYTHTHMYARQECILERLDEYY
jgi:hypothetical protein